IRPCIMLPSRGILGLIGLINSHKSLACCSWRSRVFGSCLGMCHGGSAALGRGPTYLDGIALAAARHDETRRGGMLAHYSCRDEHCQKTDSTSRAENPRMEPGVTELPPLVGKQSSRRYNDCSRLRRSQGVTATCHVKVSFLLILVSCLGSASA